MYRYILYLIIYIYIYVLYIRSVITFIPVRTADKGCVCVCLMPGEGRWYRRDRVNNNITPLCTRTRVCVYVFVCVCNNVYAHDCYTEGCRRSVVGGEGVQVLYMPAGLIKRVMILSPTTSFQKSYNACTLSAVCPVVIPSPPPPLDDETPRAVCLHRAPVSRRHATVRRSETAVAVSLPSSSTAAYIDYNTV